MSFAKFLSTFFTKHLWATAFVVKGTLIQILKYGRLKIPIIFFTNANNQLSLEQLNSIYFQLIILSSKRKVVFKFCSVDLCRHSAKHVLSLLFINVANGEKLELKAWQFE